MGARFAQNVPWARKSFWTHPMEVLGDVGHVESHLFPVFSQTLNDKQSVTYRLAFIRAKQSIKWAKRTIKWVNG